jgi:glucosamine--fructose-6-phosphate aminotransferase (isomerizing)
MTLRSEIFEQPEIIKNLLETQMDSVKEIAAEIQAKEFNYVFLSARGTSDNAGRYAKYLWGAHNQMPIALAAPSLFSMYQKPPKLDGAFVVGISQSGQSPDIVSVLSNAKENHRPALAIVNVAKSPMADAADWVIDVQAHKELAVAATKSYTAQLTAIAMLSVALNPDPQMESDLYRLPEWMASVLAKESQIEQIAQRYRYMEKCAVLGRGYNYSTAFEWSLKMKELTYVIADPYSTADFQHGPIAMVDHGFPVMALAPNGPLFESMFELLKKLRYDHRAELMIVSNRQEALEIAQAPIALPTSMPEWLSPIVSILPGQLFSMHLTIAKGYDTEKPRGLRKVTETK